MAIASFDITSTVDLQEVDNAVNQARKELGQRYDFKGSKAAILWVKNDYGAVRGFLQPGASSRQALPATSRAESRSAPIHRPGGF